MCALYSKIRKYRGPKLSVHCISKDRNSRIMPPRKHLWEFWIFWFFAKYWQSHTPRIAFVYPHVVSFCVVAKQKQKQKTVSTLARTAAGCCFRILIFSPSHPPQRRCTRLLITLPATSMDQALSQWVDDGFSPILWTMLRVWYSTGRIGEDRRKLDTVVVCVMRVFSWGTSWVQPISRACQ